MQLPKKASSRHCCKSALLLLPPGSIFWLHFDLSKLIVCCRHRLWLEFALQVVLQSTAHMYPLTHTKTQSLSAWAPNVQCNKIFCRPCQRRKLASLVHALSLADVKRLVESNSSELLHRLMKGKVSKVSWAQRLLCCCLLRQSPNVHLQ